jgi:Fur family peroxide stress response transcriptional regulator
MNPDNPELLKRLREHEMRPTEARRLILALLGEKNDHLTPEGILKALQNHGYPMSIATLYQNLNKLVEAGLLISIKDPNGLTRLDANLAPHHHLVCKTCGRMVDVKINQENHLQKYPVDFQTGISLSEWHINHVNIEFQGTCPDCKN